MDNNRLERVEEKLDKVVEHISSIDVTLAKQHISLKDHIRRTELLEQQVEPIKKHVNMVQGALKLIGLVSVCLGIVELILKLVGKQ